MPRPLAVLAASLVVATAGCSSSIDRAEPAGTGGNSAHESGGIGARSGGSGGRPSGGQGGISTGGSGGAAGSGGSSPGSDGSGGTTTGSGGGPVDASPEAGPDLDAAAVDASDARGPEGPGACGTSAPGTVLELRASGKDPYAYFAGKNLSPIDGPKAGYITDTGCSFKFVLHQDGAEEVVSSGANRQRNELTVNPGNPAMYKGTEGDTMTYLWRFKLNEMNAEPTWCDIFQLKPHGALGVAPYLALQADKDQLMVEHFRAGDVRMVPLASIKGVWLNARLTVKLNDAGSMTFTLRKDDGQMVISYENANIDMWETSTDFVRPKWGLYRNKKPGAGEASIEYNDMTIIRGEPNPVPSTAGCGCKN